MKWIFCCLFFLPLLICAEKVYPLDLVIVRYQSFEPHLPSIYDITNLDVTFGVTHQGLSAPKRGMATKIEKLYRLGVDDEVMIDRSGLVAISQKIIAYFHSLGIQGVRVMVDPKEINAQGEDIRGQGNASVTFLIYVGTVGQVRTLSKDQVNHKKHAHIKRDAPTNQGKLLKTNELENYVYYLNRHPNRRVDMEVGAFGEPGLASIDFLIQEDKPWRLYGNVSNTGPSTVEQWQQIIGYVNTQLTNFDDILVADFATDSFNQYIFLLDVI